MDVESEAQRQLILICESQLLNFQELCEPVDLHGPY